MSCGPRVSSLSARRHSWLAWLALALGGLATSCTTVGHVSQLDDDWYRVMRPTSAGLASAIAGQRVYVQQRGDTLLLTPASPALPATTFRYRLQPTQPVRLMRRRFDLDVFTIPFKVRPPRGGVPVQLNTNFNAAIYLGRRLDFYSVRTRHSTPFGATPHIRATGIGYGAFVGAGSAIVNPDVTRQHATVAEYEGLVLHGGLAAIYDARAFNIGLAVGLDQLMGPDGPYWVYRHQPWFGVLFGLDLN